MPAATGKRGDTARRHEQGLHPRSVSSVVHFLLQNLTAAEFGAAFLQPHAVYVFAESDDTLGSINIIS